MPNDMAPLTSEMSRQAIEAERLAGQFGLTYLSCEGYQKLADLLATVKGNCRCQADRDGLADLVVGNKAQRW